MGILTYSEDPGEMLHSAAFRDDLHSLIRKSSEKEVKYFGKYYLKRVTWLKYY